MTYKQLTIKDHIQGEVVFEGYRSGVLWYKASTGLQFPVPIEDTQTAFFPAREKGIFFMRWIRKFLIEVEKERKANDY